MKISHIIYCCLVLTIFCYQHVNAQIYLPVQKNDPVQSVTLDKKTALIAMKDYKVTVPLVVMQGDAFVRANGTTPEGMSIGLKYNKTILRLLVVDKSKKNYMVTHFIVKNAKNITLPTQYKDPILEDDLYISSVQFIQSYPLWPTNSTSRGFDLLSQKERSIIQLFPAIRLEIADKLCRSDSVTSGIFELLPQSQNLSCDKLELFNNTKYFNALKEYANNERALLVNVIECSQGVKNPKSCHAINKKLADKVLESVTMHIIIQNIQ